MNKEKEIEKWLAFSKQDFHPVLPVLTQADAVRIRRDHGLNALNVAIAQRNRIIQNEKADPLRYGWEPPMWWLCDALRGQRFPAPAWEKRFPGVDWMDWAEAVRLHLGVKTYWQQMLIEGANRAGKSEYAAKRTVLTLIKIEGSRVWCFHSSNQNSVEYQQPLIWKYMPEELRRTKVKSQVGYISFTQKNGFTDGRFVMPSGSDCSFRNYEQEMSKIEGGEIDLAWCDELVPADWVTTLKARVATRRGSVLVTFTPVQGYTPTVRLFEDGSKTILEEPAYLVPKDGGAPLVHEAMGFADLESMLHAHDYHRWSLTTEYAFMDTIAAACRG